MDLGFGRSIVGIEGNFIPKINTYSVIIKCHWFLGGSGSINIQSDSTQFLWAAKVT